MSARQVALRVGQVCLLVLAAGMLFAWWRVRPPVVVSDDAIDDLIEQVGDTYVPVHATEIKRGTLRQFVTAYGTVEPAAAIVGHDAGSASVTGPTAAAVATVDCTEGQLVEKGQPLFALDARAADAAIEQAQRLVEADQAALETIGQQDPATPAWRVADAHRQLAADQAVLERARMARNLLTIVAPIAGTVTQLNITPGEMADPTKIAVEIVDLDRLVASVDVPAASLAELRAGQPAAIDLRSDASTTQPAALAGNVVLVDAAMNPATGMGSADIAIPAGSGLRPGQFVRVQITTGEESDRLIVPMQSITQNQYGEAVVGKVETDGRWAMLTPVKTGWRDGNNIEIEGEGLEAGQLVVTTEANGLTQRTRLHLLKD